MHAAYTRDPITKKLAAFKMPIDVDVVSQAGRELIINGVKAELKPHSPVLISIDCAKLNQVESNDNEPEVA